MIDNQIVGVIPAAGRGKRLSPFPCPKELFPIGYQDYRINGILQKRPKVISQYLLENIIYAGAEKIVVILGEGKHDIMGYYGDGERFDVDIAYLFQEKLFGMPYAINLARNWIPQATVIFGMPDTIIEPKDAFKRLLDFHILHESDLTLGLFPTNNPSKFGMVEIDSQNDVKHIVDKPRSTDLKYMWGGACWSPAFTELINEYLVQNPFSGKEIVLGDVFYHAIEKKMRVKALPFIDGKYFDIGTTDELDLALKKFHL